MSELLITNLAEVAAARGARPLGGDDQGRVERLAGAEVYCRDGRIAFVGSVSERRRELGALAAAERLDGAGGTLVPGFVDAHTHLPWAGSREKEFGQRLAGRTGPHHPASKVHCHYPAAQYVVVTDEVRPADWGN